MATVTGGNLSSQLTEYRPGSDTLRIGNYFGLAMKAGLLAAGDMATEKALKTKHAHLLVLAQDIAPALAKEFSSLAEKYRLPLLWWPDKHSLGLTVGKSRRGALALMDKGFSIAILQLCEKT